MKWKQIKELTKEQQIHELQREVSFLKSKIEILEMQLEWKKEEEKKFEMTNKKGYMPVTFNTRIASTKGVVDEGELKEVYMKQYW